MSKLFIVLPSEKESTVKRKEISQWEQMLTFNPSPAEPGYILPLQTV